MTNLKTLTAQMKFSAESMKKRSATISVAIDVLIVFFLVTLVAVSLRLIYDAFFYKQNVFSLIDTAYAAELTDSAAVINQSHTYINIKPDTGFTVTLKFQNTGNVTWTGKDYYLKALPSSQHYYHDFWVNEYIPAYFKETEVNPGEYATFVFAVQSPSAYLLYNGEFVLVKNNMMVPCDRVKITFNVVTDPNNVPKPVVVAPIVTPTTPPANTTLPPPTAPVTPKQSYCSLAFRTANAVDASMLDNTTCETAFNLPKDGPIMRVGLYSTNDMISIQNTAAWQVKDKDDILLASIPAGISINFFYNDATSQYIFDATDKTIKTASYLTLKNINDGYFTINSYHDKPSANSNIDYNDFIGDLEIRHNDYKDRTWVIDILPMETYLKGIQETTNYDPPEYQKTMSIAARTYAAYLYDRNTKHVKEFFHVDATYDQVYRGHVTMLIFPKIAVGVDATTGIVATYDDKVIVAPYFSHSDGRTRSFAEVWKTEVPYLISKPAPYSEGRELLGHGVGIDATDALRRAKYDGWTHDQLLKYYYTGIKLEKIY